MAAATPHEVTQLLLAWRNGDAQAFNELFALVEAELRLLARQRLQHERPNHTLQPSALVNEVYLRLAGEQAIEWRDRAHFFAIATERMKQILVDYARRRKRDKRGGGALLVTLSEAAGQAVDYPLELLAVDEALERLATLDPRHHRIVVMRYFGGLTESEIADVLGLAPRTVQREWKSARAWLYSQLKQTDQDDA
jgi:RNA polymerase sigma factor (TIGR02999 family)